LVFKPGARHGLERVARVVHRLRFGRFAQFAGLVTMLDQLSGRFPALAGLFQRHFRLHPEGRALFLVSVGCCKRQ
jgi:hypothetical protein